MELIIDRDNVALVDYNNKMGKVEELITREEFESTFHISLNGITNVTYAPLKNQYFVTYGEVDVKVFNDTTKNEVLNHIVVNKDAIVAYIEAKWIEEHKPSKYHIMQENGTWYISPENQVLLDNEDRIVAATLYLKQTDWIIVKINEAQLLGQDTQPLLTKYSAELAERETKREIINSLEG